LVAGIVSHTTEHFVRRYRTIGSDVGEWMIVRGAA
jgi:hypothetical protein